MNREIISDKQAIVLVILFIAGSSLVIGTGSQAGLDSWIAIIIAIIFASPVLFIYSKILCNFQGKDLFDVSELIFGKLIGKFINIMYIWFAIHLGALVLRNFGEFIVTIGLTETPIGIPMMFFTFLCIYVGKEGIEVLGRCSEVFIFVIIVLLILLVLGLIPEYDINNIKPSLYKGINPLITGAFSVFSFPLAETVVFMLVFSCLKRKSSYYKGYLIGLLLGGTIIFITALVDLLVLGENLYSSLYYTAYSAAARINIGNFIQRIEVIVGINFIMAGLIKISICLIGACNGISKLFKINNYRIIVVPMGLLMFNLSYLIYRNTMEMGEWAFSIWPYYSFLFEVLIPIVIFIGIKIKRQSTAKL